MIFLGIDPGMHGAIAWRHHELVKVLKMPETEHDIWAALRIFTGLEVVAVIEKVGPMPQQGIASTAKFMLHYGGLRMALAAAGISFEAVPPGVWQRAMGCLTKGDKNVTKRRAQELFPHVKVTHAVADALLLMEYTRRFAHGRKEPV